MPLVPLATFLAVQLGAAIWWASKVSSQLEGLREDMRDTRQDIAHLRDEVQNHDTAIAVLETIQAKARNGASRGA